VDTDRSRVALSLKRLRPNPWATVAARYQPGQIAEATITSIVPFGAFARLEEGLDGLIHISEICPPHENASPKDLLSEGQAVKVRIMHIDAPNQRLGLGLIQDGDR
jgi:small subunit ribosomal protein S1